MNIEISAVSKGYRREDESFLPVVENLTFDIAAHEFVCVIGPSGCGKSTLLGLLGGLNPPDSGTVSFTGERSSSGPLSAIVWQDYALIPWRSIRDNVAFGLEMRGVGRRERHARAERYLAMMGIAPFASSRPHQLSGGMRQRAGIARALATDPEVLLMDEPFAAVDAQTRTILQDELLRVWEEDRKTVIFITHNIDEALLMGDRVVVLGARPTHVVDVLTVPFERPRGRHTELDPRFADLKMHLWEQLQASTEATEQAEVEAAQ